MARARDIAAALRGGGRNGAATPWRSGAHAGARAARARRRVLVDRLARWAVRAGGFAIIASILGILLFITVEVLPLLGAARVDLVTVAPLAGAAPVRALVADDFGSHVAALDEAGVVRAVRLADQRVVLETALLPAGTTLTAGQVPPGSGVLTGATDDGRIVLAPVRWRTRFEAQTRVIEPELAPPLWLEVDPARRPVTVYAANLSASGAATAAALLADETLVLTRQTRRENEFTGATTTTEERFTAVAPGRVTHLVLDPRQQHLFGADADGNLLWWRLGAQGFGDPQIVPAGPAVSALTLLLGGRSLVVGQADGGISIWFLVPEADGALQLTRIREFARLPAPIAALAPSERDKGFLAEDSRGGFGLYHSTSHRELWSGAAPFAGSALAFAPRGTAAYLAGDGQLATFAITNPHPEVSLSALFGRVWYEGYAQPEFVWQSSSGTDDFEPKLSLTPLLVGTLKGTFYSLLIAIPLAVFGAMYLSQFTHPRLKTVVKPAVEIMAALPSVVLGFLAGLWLAPRVQQFFPALILMMLLFPLLSIGTGLAWNALPRTWRNRLPAGAEIALFVVVLAGGLWASIAASPWLEATAFGGNFQAWLLEATGLAYDQRNAIIVGLAMGFAVIPIIFAIAEDSFSNVPRELVSGSLALGANRWQTVTRIVLPTASPGIFSAIMVGFGRAVGETMIVLMATGNTPILDWSPFNGFRTLSANIAVEIPEAPVDGTLYRVLFLAALALFVVTFLVNTAAELVRQRLRRRYAQL